MHVDAGKNSQILLFFEIISILPLFNKYVAITFLKLEFDKKFSQEDQEKINEFNLKILEQYKEM